MKSRTTYLILQNDRRKPGNSLKCHSLDAFLELKLENERLREELRELRLDEDEYDEPCAPHPSFSLSLD